MLEIFRKLSGTKTPTAADLREALAQIDEVALDAAVTAAEVDRKEKLLSGDDRAVDAAEARLATARRDRDRACAAKEELEARIVEADAAEARAELDAERAAVNAEAEAVARDLKKIYPRAANEIVDVLERLAEAEKKVRAVNQKLIDAGRVSDGHDDRLDGVENRVFGHQIDASSVRRWTTLRPCFGSPGYGEAVPYMATFNIDGTPSGSAFLKP